MYRTTSSNTRLTMAAVSFTTLSEIPPISPSNPLMVSIAMARQVLPCILVGDRCECKASFMDFHIEDVASNIVDACTRYSIPPSSVTDAEVCLEIAECADLSYQNTSYCTTRQSEMCAQVQAALGN